MLAYFVVFWKNGFSPSDLKKAQEAGGEFPPLLVVLGALTNSPVVYFLKSSPDFINHSGRIISASAQVDALGQAQAINYFSIFITQCFNIFAVKAKLRYPFGRQVINNKWNFVGILFGACLAVFVIYPPPFHVVFGGSVHSSPLYWLIPVGFGILLLAWASLRVVILRKSIEHKKVKDIKGLMMFPTMRTMSVRP